MSFVIGPYSKQEIDLSILDLDTENFRTGDRDNQSQALNAMFTRSSTKLLGLVESITANGFHNLELPCVFPSKTDGHFTIAEGNRRITALKVLKLPTLADSSPVSQKIKSMAAGNKKTLPQKIECAVFKDRKDCLAYVLMRHGYTSDGSNLVAWNSISKRRAMAFVSGKDVPELKVVDFVIQNGTVKEDHIANLENDEFNITNLQRLVSSSVAKKILGIKDKNCLESDYGTLWLLKVWQRVVETIMDKIHRGQPFNVDKNINDAAQIEEFIADVIEDVHGIRPTTSGGASPTAGSSSSGSSPGSTGPSTSTPAKHAISKKRHKKHQTTKQRKALIPKHFSPEKLLPQKLIDLTDELKVLDINVCTISGGVMFRVFLELTVLHYLRRHKINVTKPNSKVGGQPIELSLREKLKATLKHLKTAAPHLSKGELKGFQDLCDNTNPISIDSLNAFVHSSSYSPDSNSLKVQWNNAESVLLECWKK